MEAPETRTGWLERRRNSIGSSDGAAVLGISPFRTALDVYLAKVEGLGGEDGPPLAWGRRLESVVAEAYEEETGRPLSLPSQDILYHPTLPWLSASLDRVRADGGVVEIKVSGWRRGWGPAGSAEVPAEYYLQVQQQMAVTGTRTAEVAALLCGVELRVYEIAFEPGLWGRVEEILRGFWEGHVCARKPPTPDWKHPATAATLKALYPDVSEEPPRELADEEYGPVVREWARLSAEWAELGRQRDALKLQLLWGMGEAGSAITDGWTLTRKKIRRRCHTVPATEYIQFNARAVE